MAFSKNRLDLRRKGQSANSFLHRKNSFKVSSIIFKPIEVLENAKTNKFAVFRRVPGIVDGQNYAIKEIAKNSKFQHLLPLSCRKKNSLGLQNQNIQLYGCDPSEDLHSILRQHFHGEF
jgi:hypothetical protein